MPLRLTPALTGPRTVVLVDDVTMTFAPMGYAALRRMQAEAARRVREDMPQAAADAVDLPEGGGVPHRRSLEAADALAAAIEVMLLDLRVERFCTGWAGIVDGEGRPVPYSVEAWRMFRDAWPGVANLLRMRIDDPAAILDAEGNV